MGFSIGNKGYLGGGDDEDSDAREDFWEYDPVFNSWTQKADLGGGPKSYGVGFSIGNKGYFGLGQGDGIFPDFWEYDPLADAWAQKADFGGEPSTGAVGFSIGTKGYIKNAADFWEYDPLINGWVQKADFGGTPGGNVGFSIGTKGYIGTSGDLYNEFWEYTQCTGSGLIVYADADGDDYGNVNDSLFVADCNAPPGYVYDSSDCNDGDDSINPAATEICDGIDNNCDGNIDPLYTFYADTDGDGYGDSTNSLLDCTAPLGYVSDSTDCDDTNGSINPAAVEICNEIDDNCNVSIDDGVFQLTCYPDNDGDGYGYASDSILACSPPLGYVANNIDCNDNNASVHPSASVIAWQKSFGGSEYDEAYSIRQTPDEGSIVAGYSESNYGNVDYWILKLNASGIIEWQKYLGGTGGESAHSIQQTTDNGYIVAGSTFSSDGDVSGNHGSSDYWIVKLDSSGNLIWQKCLGGINQDNAVSIEETDDGGYIVAGSSNSNDGDVSGNHGNWDYWIVKLDLSGNIQWQKCLGGSAGEIAYSIQHTMDGGFIVAGYSYSNDGDVSGNYGSSDYWIVKLDASGNIAWQKSLGGSVNDEANSVSQTSDGGFIIAGSTYSNDGDVSGNHGNGDYWIVKLDQSGNIQWQKNYGGSENDLATYIQQTDEGGFITAGRSYSNDGDVAGWHPGYDNFGYLLSDYWLVKLDPSGNLEWQKCFGGSGGDFAYAVQPSTDGQILVAGSSDSNDGDVSGNHGSLDYWIVKLHSFPGGIEICNGLDDDCSGTADDGLIFNTYFADADNDGFGNPNNMIDSCAQPLGYVTDSTDCDDSKANVYPGAQEILSNGIDDNCDGYIDEFGTGLSPHNNPESALSVFPNPTNGEFMVYLQINTKENSEATIEVINQLGQVVWKKTGEVTNGKLNKEIRMYDTATGIYLVRVILNEKVFSGQIVYQK